MTGGRGQVMMVPEVLIHGVSSAGGVTAWGGHCQAPGRSDTVSEIAALVVLSIHPAISGSLYKYYIWRNFNVISN